MKDICLVLISLNFFMAVLNAGGGNYATGLACTAAAFALLLGMFAFKEKAK